MFKILSEGPTKDKKWHPTIHYINQEGVTFYSIINVPTTPREKNVFTRVTEDYKESATSHKLAEA